jgi:type I restriction-modification system DNA methylase subunit
MGKKADYSEADVGSKFILPLLSALGWDVTKIEDVKEQRRTLTGVADYSLYNVGGTAKIFLELKKFEEDLDGSRHVVGKVRSFPQIAIDYAWQSKADWAVLTNFEEIRLYYSRVKKPEEGLIFRLRYNEFLSKFDKLWLLSKESVVSGLLDTFEKRRLRRDVDEELLKDLVYCRKLLVANVRKNNPQLSKDEINEATQKILDRLMFIRSCEDRLIIPAESLWTQFSVWQKIAIDKSVRTFMMDLKNIFRDFDAVYNGKLFAPHLCEDLRIDNEVLESVLIPLYNYNFDLIPVDVLGNAYELYIGTIIKEKEGALKEDELTLVEEPSVRKKHGIYYTPEFVVDYIVRNTLGKLLKNCKTLDEVSKIKVLDPACGSGSFLINAFDVIKEWYDNYNKQNRLAATPNTLDAHFQVVPNVEEKILTENLYGVDLDPQAVEITILNLSLKAVKTKKKLPYMGDHIKCGNSIIFDQPEKMKEFFGENWIEKKPFNWKEEFPEVFAQEGFDVVIANPPYYNIQTIKDQHEKKWLEKNFKNVFTGESDIHYFFYVRGIELLKSQGLLGFISSRYFMEATQAEPFRQFIQSNCKIRLLLDFGSVVKVFRDATINTVITILEKTGNENERQGNQIKVVKVSSWENDLASLINHIRKHLEMKNYFDDNISIFEVAQHRLTPQIWQLVPVAVESIIIKVSSKGVRLADLCDIFKSLESGLDAVSKEHLEIIDSKGWRFTPSLRMGEPVFRINWETVYGKNLEIEACKPLLTNENIKRYMLDWKNEYLIFLLDDDDIEKYPNIKSHLLRYKPLSEERYDAKNRGAPYYAIANPRNVSKILSKKDRLITPYIAPENRFAYVHGEDNYIYKSDVYVVMPKDECLVSLKFIQGILNSELFEFMHKHTAKAVDGAARTSKGKMGKRFSYQAKYISSYPILLPKTEKEEKICEEIVTLVNKITEAKRKHHEINVDFNRYLTEPIMSYANFKDYYKKLDVKDKEALDKSSKGTIKRIQVMEQDTWLTFKVDYFAKTDKTKEEFTEFPVLKCRFENTSFRKFLLYAFQNYKKRWGSGNLLSIILNTSIPCFDKNPEKNNQIIEKIMKEFLKAVEEKERLEKEIQQTDNTIDSKVYELYGLTPEEISIVENSLKQK